MHQRHFFLPARKIHFFTFHYLIFRSKRVNSPCELTSEDMLTICFVCVDICVFKPGFICYKSLLEHFYEKYLAEIKNLD